MGNNSIIKKLKDKSGTSMIFVLGTMLLLMAIGVSVLAAASANAGISASQQTLNQLKMYAESAQKTIMYSIQKSDRDIGKRVDDGFVEQPETLGGQLIKALYQNINYELEEFTTDGLPSSLELTMSGDDVPNINVDIEFSNTNVDIIPFEKYVEEIPDNPDTEDIDEFVPAINAQAKSASIRTDVTFTIEVEHNDKSVTYAITYQLTGVEIIMDEYEATMTGESNIMIISSPEIIWRVLAYDKIDY